MQKIVICAICSFCLLLFYGCDATGAVGVYNPQDPSNSTPLPDPTTINYESLNGGYHFQTNDPKYINGTGSTFWVISNQVSGTISTKFSAQISKNSGNSKGGYGLVFAASNPIGANDIGLDNFLMVQINNNGYFQVNKVVNRQCLRINTWGTTETWRSHSSLAKGLGVSNKITINYYANDPLPFEVVFNDDTTNSFRFAQADYDWTGRFGFVSVVTVDEKFTSLPVEPVETLYIIIEPSTGVIFQ